MRIFAVLLAFTFLFAKPHQTVLGEENVDFVEIDSESSSEQEKLSDISNPEISQVGSPNDEVVDTGHHENAINDALEEMKKIHEQEEAEQAKLQEQLSQDQEVAKEAERAAKEAEEVAIRAAKEAAASAEAKKAEANDDLDWVRRMRPGGEAKPGANLKAATTTADVISEEKRERDFIPEKKTATAGSAAGGGAYFGESPKEKERQIKAEEEAKRALEKDKISSGAGDRRREVEGKISPQLRARAATAAARKAEDAKEKVAWEQRAAISRRYARPIERILKIRGDPATNLEVVSLYKILGVKRDADEDAIKRAYRIAVLKIHPDKNPHPDAKLAFDTVQAAYDTLTSPVKRAQHDEELSNVSIISRFLRSFSIPKLSRAVISTADNFKSRTLLLVRRVKDGEVDIELEEAKERLSRVFSVVSRKIDHLSRLPTFADRISLVGELVFSRTTLLGILLIILRNL